jgi:hypothetical protein
MHDNIAWRLFTKGITPAEAAQHTVIEGNRTLGETLLDTVAILA